MDVEGVKQRGRPRKTWKEVVDKDVDDLHIKPSDGMDHSKWSRMIRGNLRAIKQVYCFCFVLLTNK